MNMEKNYAANNAFLNALKDVTTNIPYTETDKQAKKVIAVAIKKSEVPTKDVLDYILSFCKIPSTFSEKEWKHILQYHIKWNDQFGQSLNNIKDKYHSITEEQFSLIATGFGKDSSDLLKENKIDEYGWLNVLNALKAECKRSVVEETANTEDTTVISKTKRTIVMKNAAGVCIAEFGTSKEATEKTGICQSSIRKCLNKYNGYLKLKTKDGEVCTFEYKEVAVDCPAKPIRSYNKNKIVIVDKVTGMETIYDNVTMAADVLGLKKDELYYRAKASNHNLKGFEVWYENDYKTQVTQAA